MTTEYPDVAPTIEREKTAEKSKHSIGARLLVGASALALAGGAAFGISMNASGNSEEAQPPQSTSESTPDVIVPAPEPVETVEVPQTVEYNPYAEPTPEALVQYQEMSFENFELLPKEEQAPYISWLTRHTDTFKAEWQDQKAGANDRVSSEVSVNNTSQEIIAESTWMLRVAVSLHADDGKKIVSFLVETNKNSEQYATLLTTTDIPDRKPRAMAEAQMMPIPTVTSESEMQIVNDVPTKTFDSILEVKNIPVDTTTMYYHEYTDHTGQIYPVWLAGV